MNRKKPCIRFCDEADCDLFYLSRYVRIFRDQEWLSLANTLYGTSIRFNAGDSCAEKLIESLQEGVDEVMLIKLLDDCAPPKTDFTNLLRRCMVE